ncbi:MAG: PilZ domain-containing protein [Oscillospiraceae bacterium]|nr:PilZ domain-containing protein [Oscillospiraceae bacterium]
MATEIKEAYELDLRPGMTVEVLTPDNKLTYLGKIDRFNGEMLQISDGVGREVPPVLFGTEVKLRGFLRGLRPFELRGKVRGSTLKFWRIDGLEGQPMHERFYYRQTITLDVKAQRAAEDGRADPATAVPCRILDISCGGVGLRSREQYEVEELLILEQVQLLRDTEPFTFRCRICNARQEGIFFRYGCELEDLGEREQDRLLAVILQLQRQAIQSRRG